MTSSRRLYLPLVLLAVVSLGGDLLCRALARGGDPERLLQAAGKCLRKLPERIGSWRAAEGEPVPDEVLRMLDCRAHESRMYVDELTGDRVGFLLLAGSAGPLVAHTPEVCYSSVDFEIAEAAAPVVIRETGARVDTFDRVTFRSHSLVGQKQRVYYAWRKFDGTWDAPRTPRLTLGGQPMLYKLQLSAEAPATADDTPANDATRRFLTDLLPVLDTILKSD
jgi:hypothetical protein